MNNTITLSWRCAGDLLVEILERHLPKTFPAENRAIVADTIQQMARLADEHVETVGEMEDAA
jgi:hypothetical protein